MIFSVMVLLSNICFHWNSLCYNTVQYNTIFHTALCWQKQNINQCQITNYTPYLARVGELWGRFCEDLVENWPRFNGTALYNCFFSLLVCILCYSDFSYWSRRVWQFYWYMYFHFCHLFISSSLPELLEKKHVIDMHTNVATAMLEQIKVGKWGTAGMYMWIIQSCLVRT